jgi:hypothetical protein
VATPIPQETAVEICEQIRRGVKGKLFSVAAWQCWGCKFSKGDLNKMCFANAPGMHGPGKRAV